MELTKLDKKDLESRIFSYCTFRYKDLSHESEKKPAGSSSDDQEEAEDEEENKEKLATPSLWRIYNLNREEWGFLFFGAIGSLILGITSPFFAIAFR